MCVYFNHVELQRSLMLKDVSSFLHVGGYILTVAASLLLYAVTAFMDPGFVPLVNQVSYSRVAN